MLTVFHPGTLLSLHGPERNLRLVTANTSVVYECKSAPFTQNVINNSDDCCQILLIIEIIYGEIMYKHLLNLYFIIPLA